jgi:hypothetical protein
MQDIRFACTALKGTGKQGVLPPDKDGYYTLPIGGLNCYNSVGAHYPYAPAKALFEQSSSLMRRIKTGCLKGEYGHPKKEAMDMDAYIDRIMKIDEKSVCVHFEEIWLDFNAIKDDMGRPIVAIMASLKPDGPYADSLSGSLNDPRQDTCFSIRSFTEDTKVAGVNQRSLVEIVTWDYVTEPGINQARKYKSPNLQSYEDHKVVKEDFSIALSSTPGVGIEDGSEALAHAIFKMIGFDHEARSKPSFINW